MLVNLHITKAINSDIFPRCLGVLKEPSTPKHRSKIPVIAGVMSAKARKGRFSLNYRKIISGASLKPKGKINLSRFHESGRTIKTINGGGQSPQQLPSLCKPERVG